MTCVPRGYEHPLVHAPTREVLRHRTLSWLPRILRSRVTFVPFAWPPWNAARVVDPSNNPRSARCTSTQADGTPSDSGSVPWPTAPATTPPSPSWRSPARGVQNQGETPLAAEAQAARTRRTAAASASLVPGFPSSSLAVNPRRSRARVWRRAGVGTNATVLSRASESTAVRMACVANEVIAALGSDRHLQFRHSDSSEVHTALRDRTSKRTRVPVVRILELVQHSAYGEGQVCEYVCIRSRCSSCTAGSRRRRRILHGHYLGRLLGARRTGHHRSHQGRDLAGSRLKLRDGESVTGARPLG